MLALVFLARLVEIGIHELARHIDQPPHCTADRSAIDMHIEHAHKNRNARDRFVRQPLMARAVIDT